MLAPTGHMYQRLFFRIGILKGGISLTNKMLHKKTDSRWLSFTPSRELLDKATLAFWAQQLQPQTTASQPMSQSLGTTGHYWDYAIARLTHIPS